MLDELKETSLNIGVGSFSILGGGGGGVKPSATTPRGGGGNCQKYIYVCMHMYAHTCVKYSYTHACMHTHVCVLAQPMLTYILHINMKIKKNQSKRSL